MVDRRESFRYNCLHDIDLFTSDGTMIHGVVSNMSEQGLHVHTPCPLPDKTMFIGLLGLVDPKTQDLTQLRMQLRVVYCVHDAQTLDFRSGLKIYDFTGDGERVFMDVLDHQAQRWDSGLLEPIEIDEPLNHQAPSETYILTRKIRLCRESQPWFAAWTQRISNCIVTVALNDPQPLNRHYQVLLPVMLPESNRRKVIKIVTEVFGVVLSSSGNEYEVFLRFLYINEDDKEFLNEELRQRFGAHIPLKAVPLENPDDYSFLWPRRE